MSGGRAAFVLFVLVLTVAALGVVSGQGTTTTTTTGYTTTSTTTTTTTSTVTTTATATTSTTTTTTTALSPAQGLQPRFWCEATSYEADVDQPFSFEAHGGRAPFQWSASQGLNRSGTGARFTSSFASAGNYAVTVTDADALSTECWVQVDPGTLACHDAATTLRTNRTITFWSSGGAAPYAWSAIGASPRTASGTSTSIRYAAAGTYTVTVTDAFGSMADCHVTALWSPAVVTATSTATSSTPAPMPGTTSALSTFSDTPRDSSTSRSRPCDDAAGDILAACTTSGLESSLEPAGISVEAHTSPAVPVWWMLALCAVTLVARRGSRTA